MPIARQRSRTVPGVRNDVGCTLPGSDSRRWQIPDKLKFQRTFGVTKGYSAGYPRAPQTHLVFYFWRSFHHAARDRAAVGRNQPAGSVSDVFRRLPDVGFLSEIPRMDSVGVCGQSHLRTAFVFRVECFGLRLRDFSSAPDLFSGSFGRTASLDRQKIAANFACGGGPHVETGRS